MRLLALVLLAGCASASLPMAPPEVVTDGRSFQPAPGRARLYVFCKAPIGYVLPVVLNGHVVGGLSRDRHLMLELDPGAYVVQSHTAESVARLELAVEAGGVYFARVYLHHSLWELLGIHGTRVGLRQADEVRGRRAVMDSRLVLSTALH